MSIYKCGKCGKRTDYLYCKPCNSNYWRDNFKNWTSGDSDIDELIRESQINAEEPHEIIEWIEYDDLTDIEYFTAGGCPKIFNAATKNYP